MSDTTPPRLTSLTFPGSVNLASGPQTITFTVGATDDSSGVEAVVINFTSSFYSYLPSVFVYGGAGGWTSGFSSAADTIAVSTPPGVYTIASVDVYDNAGNESIYSTSALQQLGVATSLSVSGSDTTGPQITALSFDPTINLSSGDATFHFSASATDRSGIGYAALYFDGGLGAQYLFGSAADPWTDGTSAATSTIAVSTPAGLDHLSEIDLFDAVGNETIYTTAQLQALGLPTTVTVTGSDTVGPTLTGLSFDSKIDLSAGAATFHYAASATDRSGVGSVVLYFDGGLGAQFILGSTADPWSDGSSASTSSVGASTPPGVDHLTEVDLYDSAGNLSVYTAAQLQALGFATTVTVSNSDVTGPTLTGFTHPSTVSLLSGAANITLGVSAADRSGIGGAVVYFDKSLFGAGGSTAFILGTTADPWTDGASSVVETVPTSTTAGVYTVTALTITDTVGNVSTYTTAQLTALGYATTITVGGADTTPPQLTSLTFPTSVNVSAAAQTITFAAAATDNATGVTDVKLTFDKSFSGGGSPGIVDISGSNGDSWTDGASSLKQILPTSTLPGTYTLTGVAVTDGAGNVHAYTTAQLQALGVATSLTVVGDTTKPKLGSLLFPASIDVSTGQRVAPFTATASDNATGVRDVSVHFDKSLLTGVAGGVVDLNGVADSWSDGASTLNLIVPSTAVSGVYHVTEVDVTDGAGNVATYTPAQLAALGIATSLTIVGGQQGAPAVSFSPTLSYGGGGSTIFSGSVTDNVAIASVNVYSGSTFIGAATVNATTHSWSLTATLAAGVYASWNVVVTDVSGATASAQASFTLQTGVTGQAYVTVESDYSGGLLIDKRFVRLDGSVYLNETYVNGVKTSDTYTVTGQAYTSYEDDYDSTGHIHDIKYWGYTGQLYISSETDYSWSSVTKRYTIIEQKYFSTGQNLYETIIYNSDSTQIRTFFNIIGFAYTSYEIDYDANSHYFAKKYFGYHNLPYVTIEFDYSWSSSTLSYTLIDQKYIRSDQSVYELEIFNSDKSRSITFYNVTGFAYTSYEIDYDANGHYTAKKYFGYTGLAYYSTETDYVWSSVTKVYTLVEEKFFLSNQSLYEIITFNSDKSKDYTYYGITGQLYTSYEIDYDVSGHYIAKKYFGYTGLSYYSTEIDYSWSSVTKLYTTTEQKYFLFDQSLYETIIFNSNKTRIYTYYGVTGQSYTSYEVDFDASNHYNAKKYFGYTGQKYVTIEFDFSWSSVTNLYTKFETKYIRSDNSFYETIVYNSNSTQIWTYYGVTGFSYNSYSIYYDANLHYTQQNYYGYVGQAYVTLDRYYSWSSSVGYTLTEDKYLRADASVYEDKTYSASGIVDRFYGITGQTYTSDEFVYNSVGTLLREIQYAANGLPNEMITHNADLSLTFDFYQITGTGYSSYEITNEANGTLRSRIFFNNTGPNEIDAEENNITVVSTAGNDTIYGDGAATSAFGWGVLFQFNPNFGHDMIVDFWNRTTSPDGSHAADTIQLPKAEFADFTTFFNATVDSPSGTLSTAPNGDSLTLSYMTRTTLLAAQADFKFV